MRPSAFPTSMRTSGAPGPTSGPMRRASRSPITAPDRVGSMKRRPATDSPEDVDGVNMRASIPPVASELATGRSGVAGDLRAPYHGTMRAPPDHDPEPMMNARNL